MIDKRMKREKHGEYINRYRFIDFKADDYIGTAIILSTKAIKSWLKQQHSNKKSIKFISMFYSIVLQLLC